MYNMKTSSVFFSIKRQKNGGYNLVICYCFFVWLYQKVGEITNTDADAVLSNVLVVFDG